MSESVPLLSIVVPVYNVALHLQECLDSLTRQGLAPELFEVILVDDGSTDGSNLIAAKWAATHDNTTLITQKNAGLSAARNTGLDAAAGEFLTFVDSDDVIPPYTYRKMLDLLRESGSDFATAAAYRFTAANRHAWPFARNIDLFQSTQKNLKFIDHPEYVRDFTAWNKVYRRSFFVQSGVRFPEGRIYEDVATSPLLYCKASSFDVLGEAGYFWRLTPGSITQTVNRAKAVDRLWALEHVLDQFHSESLPQKVLDELGFAIVDYNLRWIFFDFHRFDAETQSEILDSMQRLLSQVEETPIRRVEEPISAWAQLAKSGKLRELAAILDKEVPLRDAPVESDSKGLHALHRLGKKVVATFTRGSDILLKVGRQGRQAFIYLVLRRFALLSPIDQRRVVVSNYWGTKFSLSEGPASIAVQLANTSPEFKFIVFAEKSSKEQIRRQARELMPRGTKVRIIPNDTFRYYYQIWRSKYLVNDVNFTVAFRVNRYTEKRPGQVEIQTTHGIPLKKLGVDSDAAIEPENLQKFLARSQRYDYLVSSSPMVAEIFSQAHRVSPKILKTGLPQNDHLFKAHPQSEIHLLKKKYGLNPAKQTIVYAPTFRNLRGSPFPYLIDFHQLFEEYGDTHQLLIKIHPFNYTNLSTADFRGLTVPISPDEDAFVTVTGTIGENPEFVPVSLSGEQVRRSALVKTETPADINELMLLADVFVTDYSSSMFNFSHLNKPQILFTPDIVHYERTRGCYFNIDEWAPGAVTKTTEDLISAIRLASRPAEWNAKYNSRIEAFREQFLLWEHGDAAKKIVEEVFVPGNAGANSGSLLNDPRAGRQQSTAEIVRASARLAEGGTHPSSPHCADTAPSR